MISQLNVAGFRHRINSPLPIWNVLSSLRSYVGSFIEGPIPESLSQLHGLRELLLNGNRLSGTIPPGLGQLCNLRELYLNANELEGPIPLSFSALTNLESLNMGWNRLTGDFPPCLGNMVRIPFNTSANRSCNAQCQ